MLLQVQAEGVLFFDDEALGGARHGVHGDGQVELPGELRQGHPGLVSPLLHQEGIAHGLDADLHREDADLAGLSAGTLAQERCREADSEQGLAQPRHGREWRRRLLNDDLGFCHDVALFWVHKGHP